MLSIHFYEDEAKGKHNGYLVVGGNSKEIQVYRAKDGLYFCTMVGHKDSVTCIVEDGKMLFTGSDDKTIGIWNTANWYHETSKSNPKKYVQAMGFMEGHAASIEDLKVLPNGLLMSCAFDKKIKCWEYQS